MTPSERQTADAALPGATPVPSATPVAPAAGVVPYENLSPFAKNVSEPPRAPAFGAKPPTEGQAKAQGYGSRALQAHEIVQDLESKKEFGSDYWLNFRTM